MADQNATTSNASGLVTLLELKEDSRQVWATLELSAILTHQLSARLQVALGLLHVEADHYMELLGSRQEEFRSLSDLLHHNKPPPELLKLTKRFAKICIADPESPLPREISMYLYFASIAVARVRCGRRISELPSAALIGGLQWCLSQTWLDSRSRQLLMDTGNIVEKGACS